MPPTTISGSQGDPRSRCGNWLFLSNAHAAAAGHFHHSFLALAWSLAIEGQFYLVWPALVARLSERALVRICLIAIIGAFLLRVVFTLLGTTPLVLYVMTPFRIDTLAVGALIALLSRGGEEFERLRRIARRGLPVSFGLSAGLTTLLILQPTFLGARPGLALLANPLMQTVGYSVLAGLYGFLLIHLLSAPASVLTRCFNASCLVMLGKYSYAVYLLHSPAAWIVTRYLFDPRATDWPFVAEQAVRYLLVLGLTLAMARITWELLEAPALRLAQRFRYGGQDPSSPAH